MEWFEQMVCVQRCSGLNLTVYPPGMEQFPPPASGFTGFFGTRVDGGDDGLPYSIVDHVIVPQDLQEGDCLLSWRWDSEHTDQVWQNCADVRIVAQADPSASTSRRQPRSAVFDEARGRGTVSMAMLLVVLVVTTAGAAGALYWFRARDHAEARGSKPQAFRSEEESP
jgi:hypothetical protein